MRNTARKTIAFLCAAALVLPFLFACSNRGGAQEGYKDAETLRTEFTSAAKGRQVEKADGVTTKNILETEGNTLVSVDYPALDASPAITAELEAFVNDAVSAFRAGAEAAHAQEGNADKVFSMSMTYKPYRTDGGVFSVKFTQDTDIGGEGNKVNYVDGFTYDLATGARMGLTDVFDSGQDYLGTISKTAADYLLRNEILRKSMDEDMFAQGTAAKEENYSNFVVADDKVMFIFNKNTIAPPQAGTLEVSIPLTELDALLKPESKQLIYGVDGATAGTVPSTLPSDMQQASPEYADFKTSLPQLQIEGNFMPPRSLEGIDPFHDKVVALTFDDGPHETLTPQLLDILKENGVTATFFVVGTNVEKYPELVKRAYEEGNDIGTHSWNHPENKVWKNLSVGDKLEQYRKANDAIEAATGLRSMIDRPPGGTITESEAKSLGREQVIWSMDPKDWVPDNRDPETIYANVIEGGEGSNSKEAEGYVADGGVILSHDIHATTVEAYDRIIKELKNQGYKFVTITQMMQIAEIRGGEIKYKFYDAPTAGESETGKAGDRQASSGPDASASPSGEGSE